MGTFRVAIELGDPTGTRWLEVAAPAGTGGAYTSVPADIRGGPRGERGRGALGDPRRRVRRAGRAGAAGRPRARRAPPRGRSGRPAPRPGARLPADVIEGVSKGCRPQQAFASCTDAVLDYVPGAGHGQGREHRTTSSGALLGGACAVSRP